MVAAAVTEVMVMVAVVVVALTLGGARRFQLRYTHATLHEMSHMMSLHPPPRP